jgi:protein involved in polysaccharide export with SLBB domain
MAEPGGRVRFPWAPPTDRGSRLTANLAGAPADARGPSESRPQPDADGGTAAFTEPAPGTDPEYVVQPGDALRIHAKRLVPRPSHPVGPADVLVLCVADTPPGEPIRGAYPVAPQGTIDLGFGYGPVMVAGLTVEQTVAAVRATLKPALDDPQVALALAESEVVQSLAGEHVVGPDGVIDLGPYGRVKIGGLQLCQATALIEQRLASFLVFPDASLTVLPGACPVWPVPFR